MATELSPAVIARLKARMLKIPERMQEAAARSLQASADELVQAMQRVAPTEHGALKASISSEPLESERGKVGQRVIAGDRKAYYARFVEFGTQGSTKGERVGLGKRVRKAGRTHSGSRAQPFFYPTYRAYRRRIKARLSRALKKAAQETTP